MKHANLSFFVPHIGCPHQCSFCNQNTISGETKVPTAQDVSEQCKQTAEYLGKRVQTTEIAFFGGSFTAIDRTLMSTLLSAAYDCVKQYGFAGIRVSTRPDAICEEILTLLKSYGVTAIELGAQSMDDQVLAANERGHTAQDIVAASQMIRSFGFSLGLQMMTGLYCSTEQLDRKTAEQLVQLNPDTMRIYPTVVIDNTKLNLLYQKGIYHPPGVEDSIALVADLIEMFEQRQIKVIRVGLHASDLLQAHCTAGAYHPAFGELCESHRYLRQVHELIERSDKTSRIVLKINPLEVSKLVGQHKCNLKALQQEGYQIQIIQDQTVPMGQVWGVS